MLYENEELSSLEGLAALASVGGTLEVKSSHALTDLAGLERVAAVGGDLSIVFNDALFDLTGLEGLQQIADTLILISNPVMQSLAGLENVNSIGAGVHVSDNADLCTTEIDSFVDGVDFDDLFPDVSITGNDDGC